MNLRSTRRRHACAGGVALGGVALCILLAAAVPAPPQAWGGEALNLSNTRSDAGEAAQCRPDAAARNRLMLRQRIAGADSPSLSLTVEVNQPAFVTGQTLTPTLRVVNPGLPYSADFYLGFLKPDGGVEFVTSAGGLVSGNLAQLSSFRPLVTGLPLSSPFSLTAPPFFSRQWTGSEARGRWLLFLLATKAGALSDGSVASDEILGTATAPFSFGSTQDPCDQVTGPCKSVIVGSTVIYSTETNGIISTVVRRLPSGAGDGDDTVFTLEWRPAGALVDAVLTFPALTPLRILQQVTAPATLDAANRVAALIHYLNSAGPGNHAGCDVIDSVFPEIGACSAYGKFCDEHDACIDRSCRGTDSGSVLDCFAREAELVTCAFVLRPSCAVIRLCSPECHQCHEKVVRDFLSGSPPGPSACCPNHVNRDCGKPQLCIVDNEVITDPSRCGGIYRGPVTLSGTTPQIAPGCFASVTLINTAEVSLSEKLFKMFVGGGCSLTFTFHGPACEGRIPPQTTSCVLGAGTVDTPLQLSGSQFSGNLSPRVPPTTCRSRAASWETVPGGRSPPISSSGARQMSARPAL